MPPLRPIKNIVERMKNMSHSLIVSANKNGRLALKIQTNTVSLSAHFPDLNVESFAGIYYILIIFVLHLYILHVFAWSGYALLITKVVIRKSLIRK